jgi:hypothetical protein
MRRPLLIVLLAAALVLARPAHADEPLIGQLVDYGDVRSVIPAGTLERYSEIVSLRPEQRSAASDLVAASEADLAREVNRHLRRVRDDPSLGDIRSSEKEVVEAAIEIERRLMADLALLLSPAQLAEMPRFYRAQRRAALMRTGSDGTPYDVFVFLKSAGVKTDEKSAPDLAAILSAYETRLDLALVRKEKAWIAYIANIRAENNPTPESKELSRRIENERIASNSGLINAGQSIVQPLLSLLSPDLGDRLAGELLQHRLGEFWGSVSPAKWPVVREVLALELTPQQRPRAQELIASAESRSRELIRKAVVEGARYDLADNATRATYKVEPVNQYLGDIADIRSRLKDDLLALLTPAQRSVYDASPVIDPSDTSKVND